MAATSVVVCRSEFPTERLSSLARGRKPAPDADDLPAVPYRLVPPLLVLLALDRWQRGEQGNVPFREIQVPVRSASSRALPGPENLAACAEMGYNT